VTTSVSLCTIFGLFSSSYLNIFWISFLQHHTLWLYSHPTWQDITQELALRTTQEDQEKSGGYLQGYWPTPPPLPPDASPPRTQHVRTIEGHCIPATTSLPQTCWEDLELEHPPDDLDSTLGGVTGGWPFGNNNCCSTNEPPGIMCPISGWQQNWWMACWPAQTGWILAITSNGSGEGAEEGSPEHPEHPTMSKPNTVSWPLCAKTFSRKQLQLGITNQFLSSLSWLNRDNNELQAWIEIFKPMDRGGVAGSA